MAATTNYGWEKPTVSGDSGAWGTKLNTALDEIDADLRAAENEAEAAQSTANTANTTANAALPKAGGAMTGRLTLLTESVAQVTGSGSGAQALDLALGNLFVFTTSGNVTFSFSNVPAGATGIVVLVSAGGAHTVTWPGSVIWPGGSTPSQTASSVDWYALITLDGGANWRAVRVARDL